MCRSIGTGRHSTLQERQGVPECEEGRKTGEEEVGRTGKKELADVKKERVDDGFLKKKDCF